MILSLHSLLGGTDKWGSSGGEGEQGPDVGERAAPGMQHEHLTASVLLWADFLWVVASK